METHSSVLAWRIPGMGEPGVLPSMASHRVGHDWSDLAAAAALPSRINYSLSKDSGCFEIWCLLLQAKRLLVFFMSFTHPLGDWLCSVIQLKVLRMSNIVSYSLVPGINSASENFFGPVYISESLGSFCLSYSCTDVRVGLWRKLSAEELMLFNCGVGKHSWESLGLQGDPTSPFWRRSALGFLCKDWC